MDGPTLADRIAHGSISIDEALSIALQICEALEAAHQHGVIHRDLKPANIKLRPDGAVKVLDFGLAKLAHPDVSGGQMDISHSPTITSPAIMTGAGVLLGTAAYMSPEQARGQSADQRSDIWAFGCVFYEMLTGRRAFQDETVPDIVASVLAREPDLNLLPANLNSRIRELLRRSLEKNPKRRWHAAADLRIEIENALANPFSEVVASLPTAAKTKTREWFAWALVVGLTIALGVSVFLDRNRPEPPEVRLQVVTPPTIHPLGSAISPDERQLAFNALNAGKSQVWVRSLDSVDARPLAGTEGALEEVFWSPDSASLGFFAESSLKRIDIVRGVPQVLARVSTARGGSCVITASPMT